ncbi:MAG: transposase, OrfB family [Bacteroidota bacterium]|nr:transposase, OrfB family [Bacteroidota bacterium]
MVPNDFVRNRIMEIKPIDSDTSIKKATLDTLEYLFRNLYFFANLTVAHCFETYQNTDPNSIPYLQGMERVKRMEKKLQEWYNTVASTRSGEERILWQEKISRLTEIKRYYRRYVLKKIFAAECRRSSYLQTLQTRFPQIPTIVAFNTFFEVSQQFLSDWPRVRESTRQLRQYSKGMPIYFGYDSNFHPFYIHKTDTGKEQIRFKWALDKELTFAIEFGRDKSENETILRTHIIGQQDGFKKLGDSFIQMDRRKNKIFLNQVFKLDQPTKEVSEKILNPDLILGVDLGIKVPIVWALSNGNESGEIGSKHKIPKLRAQFYNRINNLQADLKSEGASGKGQLGRLQPLHNLRKKERDLIKQINRDLAKTLIEIAVKKGAGTIHLEDLDFTERKKLWIAGRKLLNDNLTELQIIKTYDSYYDRMLLMFRNWSYAQLIRFIKEQAENYGIQVLFIDPRNTSRHCFVCKARGERKKQEFLEIKKPRECGISNCPCIKEKTRQLKRNDVVTNILYFIPADRNAAYNIACNAPRVVPMEREPIDWDTVLATAYKDQQEKKAELLKRKSGSQFRKVSKTISNQTK